LHGLHKDDRAESGETDGEGRGNNSGSKMKYAERPESAVIEKESDPEKLLEFIRAASVEARSQGIPLSEDGRVDMLAFKSLYGSDVDKDLQDTREGQTDAKETYQERLKTDGEKLEMLTYAILQKGLGKDFVVARSAPHDDKHNGVDTLMFQKDTGNLVCAFDEISAMAGADYEKKQSVVRGRNLSGGGATLKYALELQEQEGKKTIVPGQATNIPLFYVALEKDWINRGIKEFNSAPDAQSNSEKKLFDYMISAIELQIKALELSAGRLDPKLVKRLQDFKKVVELLKRK
jgi:hypothetical protein